MTYDDDALSYTTPIGVIDILILSTYIETADGVEMCADSYTGSLSKDGLPIIDRTHKVTIRISRAGLEDDLYMGTITLDCALQVVESAHLLNRAPINWLYGAIAATESNDLSEVY